MISNQININNNQAKLQETLEKGSTRCSQNIDTDPEVENENQRHLIYNFENSIQNENNKEQKELIKPKKKFKNGFNYLADKIPNYDYSIPKFFKNNNNEIILYPLNTRYTDNNRFIDHNEAFLFIAKHCKKYHNRYTRDICRQYLKECYIIDFAHDEFIPALLNLSSKEFNHYFVKSQKELKFL